MTTRTLTAIDAHTGGQPLRLITDGLPRPIGDTMASKAAWMARHADRYRGMVVLEPRGHADLTVALLTEPVTPGAHAGLLFMDPGGYSSLSGHGVVAAVTIALERGLLVGPGSGDEIDLTLDTVAGAIGVRARLEAAGRGRRRVRSVAVTHAPALVSEAGRVVVHGTRRLRVDVAFCGAWFAICDSEATGVPLDVQALPVLRALGIDICAALNRDSSRTHPLAAAGQDAPSEIVAVMFTGPPTDSAADLRAHRTADSGAHLKGVTVGRGGDVDRSACGVGVAAVMAVLDAMGLLLDDQAFVFEGLSGAVTSARIVRKTTLGECPAVVVEIEDSAWITGEHTMLAESDDPWRNGPRRRR